MNPAGRHPTLAAVVSRPFALMGIVNATPDSFYDGGRHDSCGRAVEHALRLVDEGADVIDVGGESTRPGSPPVDMEEEIRRVIPVVEAVGARTSVPISVDTTKAGVAERALQAGASWVNDISAGRFDRAMAGVVAQGGGPVVLMHSRERPATMQQCPSYEDVLAEVESELLGQVTVFTEAGVAEANIVLDPGIGFAKRVEDNLALLRGVDRLAGHGFPVLVGTSRKSFIGQVTGRDVEQRLAGSLGSVAAVYARGVRMFRVHDVAETADLLRVLSAIDGDSARRGG